MTRDLWESSPVLGPEQGRKMQGSVSGREGGFAPQMVSEGNLRYGDQRPKGPEAWDDSEGLELAATSVPLHTPLWEQQI